MTDATGPQETQVVAGLSDDDARARPAGNRRPKPVIVEKEEAADGVDVTNRREGRSGGWVGCDRR